MDTEPSRIPEAQDDRIVAPNFITAVVDEDLRRGRMRTIVTRFPPEPNGYLHIGHAKAICLDFGLADDYRGRTNLRFDDTNPTTEDPEYVEAIKKDLHWLGFDWDEERYASDYFDRLYELARTLVRRGDAYVDSQTEEEIREARGTVTSPGRPSPYRDRPSEESLDLFERMRAGEFEEGAHVLRAKIDMASPNMLMRDPLLYRIRHARHYRTGDAWHVYPMYDFAHPLSDAIEGVTHSLCSLEFENNREVYDWLVERLFDAPLPHQYEFARLYLDHTVTSKRTLLRLVKGGFVSGWDDPRMPTLAGLRRRGVTPEAIRAFVNRVGVTRANSRTDYGLLESAVRDDLNHRAPRVMAVLDPVELEITDVAEGDTHVRDADLWPHDVPHEATRPLPLGRRVWIERDDWAQDPPKGWRRFSPGAAVRLRHGPVVVCDDAEYGEDGRLVRLRGHRAGGADGTLPEGMKVSGVVHWVPVEGGLPARFRLYDRLFREPVPEAEGRDVTEALNEDSLIVRDGYVEPFLGDADPTRRWQFERQGYFWRDPVDGRGDERVFSRIVTLKDGWGRARAAADAERAAAPSKGASGPRRPAGEAGREPDPVEALDREGRARFTHYAALGLARADAARLAADPESGALFEAVVDAGAGPSDAANWIVNELPRVQEGRPVRELAVTPEALASLVDLVRRDVISAPVAKSLLAELVASGGDPETMVEARGLRKMEDGDALSRTVEGILSDHPGEVAAYRAGKAGLIGFFVGQAMKATSGRADPKSVKALFEEALSRTE